MANDLLPCGHPIQCVNEGDSGEHPDGQTRYCRWCAEVAREQARAELAIELLNSTRVWWHNESSSLKDMIVGFLRDQKAVLDA